MNLELALRALRAYGLTAARLSELGGGTINRVWRVDCDASSFVLKEYRSEYREAGRLPVILAAQRIARENRLPVPAILANGKGELVTRIDGHAYVLSEFVEGRLYAPGEIPAKAAYNMGVVLARLHDALLGLEPDPDAMPFPALQSIEAELRTLLEHARMRRYDPVDAVAEGVLEAKLALLATVASVPEVDCQWTHGDYEWRNVLVDEHDEVAAVLDFDNAFYYPAERDVMRCIALSFPNLEPAADDFFEGYAAARGLGPEAAASHVETYRYFSTFRVWPISERYLHPERYRPSWDALIRPLPDWDWYALTHRLTEVAARVRS